MLTFHVIPLFLVIASEAWNLKVCACAMILDSSLRSATFRMTECQHYLAWGEPNAVHLGRRILEITGESELVLLVDAA